MDAEAFYRDFHYLFGWLVHAHDRFDFNVGLQLNWMGSMYAVKGTHAPPAALYIFIAKQTKSRCMKFRCYRRIW